MEGPVGQLALHALLFYQDALQLGIGLPDLVVGGLEFRVSPLELAGSLLDPFLQLPGESAQLVFGALALGDLPDDVHHLG